MENQFPKRLKARGDCVLFLVTRAVPILAALGRPYRYLSHAQILADYVEAASRTSLNLNHTAIHS